MEIGKTIFVVIMSALIAAIGMLITPLIMTAAGAAGGALVEMARGSVLYDVFMAWGMNEMALISLWKIGAMFGFASAFIPKLFGK